MKTRMIKTVSRTTVQFNQLYQQHTYVTRVRGLAKHRSMHNVSFMVPFARTKDGKVLVKVGSRALRKAVFKVCRTRRRQRDAVLRLAGWQAPPEVKRRQDLRDCRHRDFNKL
jgi:hypothetical protein